MQRAVFVLTLGLIVGAVLLAAAGTEPARGEDGTDGEAADIASKVASLEAQVAYLLAREADLTAYLVRNEERGKALQATVRQMRNQGFQSRSIPAESRETLLQGLDALGEELQKDVPKVTKEQAAALRAARGP